MVKYVAPILGLFFLSLSIGTCQELQGSTEILPTNPAILGLGSTITSSELETHVRALSSDNCKGREATKTGQKRAANYLAEQLYKIGLYQAGFWKGKPSYFQRFDLVKRRWENLYVRLNNKKYTHLKDMLYFGERSYDKETPISVVLYNETLSPDQVRGKLIAYKVDNIDQMRIKMSGARSKEALGVLAFVPPKVLQAAIYDNQTYVGERYTLKKPQSYQEEFSIVLSEALYPEIFNNSNEAYISLRAQAHYSQASTENVAAYVQGGDKKDEVLVLSAHYDHLGAHGRDIYNGADDNGSGTAALLEIAQAFSIAQAQGRRPRRTVLFLFLTAEEKGLLGSDYYVRSPLFPLENTIVNLNVDMIGRIDPKHQNNANYVYLIGSDRLSSDLHKWSEQVNNAYTQIGLDYTYNDPADPNRFYYRSDHYNFAKKNIPVIFYFSGVHQDYHQASDTADKLNYTKAERISRLIFHTAYEIANRPDRPILDKSP